MGDHFEGLKGYDAYASAATVLRRMGETGFMKGFLDATASGTPDHILETYRARWELLGPFEAAPAFRFGGVPYEDCRGQPAAVRRRGAARAAVLGIGGAGGRGCNPCDRNKVARRPPMPAVTADTTTLPKIPAPDLTARERAGRLRDDRAVGLRGRGLPGAPGLRRRRPAPARPVHPHGPDGRGRLRPVRAQGHRLAPAPRLRDRHVHHRRDVPAPGLPRRRRPHHRTAPRSG